jgi:hypothetical protein
MAVDEVGDDVRCCRATVCPAIIIFGYCRAIDLRYRLITLMENANRTRLRA